MSDQCSTNPGVTHYEGCACHEQGWKDRLEAVQSELDRLLEVMQTATVLADDLEESENVAPMEDRWDYDHGPDHIREVIEG